MNVMSEPLRMPQYRKADQHLVSMLDMSMLHQMWLASTSKLAISTSTLMAWLDRQDGLHPHESLRWTPLFSTVFSQLIRPIRQNSDIYYGREVRLMDRSLPTAKTGQHYSALHNISMPLHTDSVATELASAQGQCRSAQTGSGITRRHAHLYRLQEFQQVSKIVTTRYHHEYFQPPMCAWLFMPTHCTFSSDTSLAIAVKMDPDLYINGSEHLNSKHLNTRL